MWFWTPLHFHMHTKLIPTLVHLRPASAMQSSSLYAPQSRVSVRGVVVMASGRCLMVCYFRWPWHSQDPMNCMNNVGRSSFGIRQVQKCLFEALTTLKATMVRVNQDGKEVMWLLVSNLCSEMSPLSAIHSLDLSHSVALVHSLAGFGGTHFWPLLLVY